MKNRSDGRWGNGARRALIAARLAYRGLARSRGTTVLAVGILALGLAAPTVFFSLLVGAIRPLPVPGGERIVRVEVVQPANGGRPLPIMSADLGRLQGVAGLEGLGGSYTLDGTIVDAEAAATRVSLGVLSVEVLPLLQVNPSLGRIPLGDEAAETILLGHRVWQEMYAGDPGVLGRAVEVDGVPRTVVGVMPEGFGFPFKQDSWIFLDRSDERSDSRAVELVGRLADGASMESVAAELRGRWSASDSERNLERTGGVVDVGPYTGGRGEGGETVAFVGLVLVALCLLLIACANVANLLLVRAAERLRSLGIQSALGASRGQIGGQLFLESLALALMGGVVGVLIAHAGVGAIQRSLATEHFGYFWMRMAIDGPVVAFATVLVGATAVVSGSLPALRVMSLDVRGVLQREAAGASFAGGVWGRVFVTTQLALSCAALVAAGLTARTMIGSGDFGGNVPTTEVLIADISLSANDPAYPEQIRRLEEELVQIPGVFAAAVSIGAPAFFESFGPIVLDARPVDRAEGGERVFWNAVSPGYFAIMDLELRAGRLFSERDAEGSAPVALVNQSFVLRLSPERDVIGRTVQIGARPDSAVAHVVIGVVSDAGVGTGDRARHDRVYLPLTQVAEPARLLSLRGGSDPAALAPTLRRAVAAVDPTMALSGVRTLADGHAYMTRVPRFMGAMAFGGGVAGLLVAAVGLYGLLAFRVRQRRRELGVRLALGADGRRLAQESLKYALAQLVPAIAIGLTLAWVLAPFLSVIVLGMNPRSPSTLAVVAVVFLSVGLAAAAIPTARAAATDPAEALRAN